MPNWKKLIASGSDASLNSLNVKGTITANAFSGNFQGSIANNLISANQLNVTGNGTTSQYLRSDGDGSFTWVTPPNTTYSVGNGGLTEINFTSALNTKLAGIAAGANNYSLPEATATTRGGIELFSNTDNPTAANAVSSTAGRTYGIQLNSAGQAVVNVPWVDTNTNTTYSAGTGLTLSGTTFSLTNTYDNYVKWQVSDGITNDNITSGEKLTFSGKGATSVLYDAGTNTLTITSTDTNTDTNTTYSAGTGLTLSGTTFSLTTPITNNNQLTNGAGYTTNTGTVTSIATNSGLTGGTITTSGTIGIASNGVTATHLNVSGNGTTAQYLRSDGDGTFTWATPTDTNTTYTVGDGGLTQKNFTTTLFNKLNGIATSADNYGSWTISDGGTAEAIGSGATLTIRGAGATEVAYDAASNRLTITSTDTNTDTNTTYTAGGGLSLSGTTFSHTDTSSQGSVNNSGRTYIQDITLDGYGHITGITSATETVVNTDTNTVTTLGTEGVAGTPGDFIFIGKGATSVTQEGTDIYITSTDTDTNTTYSVGDGGLTQKNFTTTLFNKLNGIAAGATNVTNNNQLTNGAGYQTSAQVSTAISNVIDSAPDTLNTLNELAAALGDDPNFATTVSTSIGTKLAKASNLSDLANVSTARTNLGLGSLATLSSVNAATITDNSVGAAELNVSGNGTTSQYLRSDGDGTFTWVTPPNTTYSVGDGGLTQKNFTTTLFNKLNGIATSADNYGSWTISDGSNTEAIGSGATLTIRGDGAAEVVYDAASNILTISSTDTNTDTNTTYSAGNGISLSGTTFSVAAGGGLTQTSTGLAHTDTSSQGSVNNSGNTVIQDVTLDGYGHVTGLASATITLSSLGFTGATNANYITNNNQLSNGAGYLTSTNDRVYLTDSRGGVRLPSYYDDRYAQWDFQSSADTEAGGDGWHAIQTISKWSSYNDSHRQEQLIFTGDNLKRRTAVSDSAWGGLKTIWDSGNLNPVVSATVSNDTTTFTKADGSTFALTTSDANSNTYVTGATFSTSNGVLTLSRNSGTVTVDLDGRYSTTDTNTITKIGTEAVPVTPGDFTFIGKGATTITQEGGNIFVSSTDTNTDTNTTYSAGNGISLSGTTFSVAAGGGLTQTSTGLAHSDTSSQGSVNNSGRTYIQDITLDTYGHITGIVSATETVVNTDTDTITQIAVKGFVPASGNFTFVGGGATTITQEGEYITITSTDTNTDTNTTYTADGNYGLTLSGTTFRLEDDRRRNSTGVDIYSGNTHDFTWYDADVGIRWYTAGAEEMRLQNDGTLHVDGDVVAYSTTVPSDERLKDNVTTIQNPLDKIKALRGVEYDWNSGNRKGKHDLGLIAQEVEVVIPEIVYEHTLPMMDDSDTLYKTVDYEKMVAVLIEGMKEQQTQIDELKSEISKLKGEA